MITSIDYMINGAVSRDGRSVILQLAQKDGEVTELEFGSLVLAKIIQEVGALLSLANQRSDLSKQGVLHPVSIADSRVAPAEGEDKVILSFRLPNTLEYHFLLKPTDATLIGKQLRESARKGKRGSRH